MSAGEDPSAERPTSGSSRFPDPFAPPAPPPDGGRTGDPAGGTAAPGPGAPGAETPSSGIPSSAAPPDGTAAPEPSPGDRDLPWKATAERRDLWGPAQKPLEGTVRSPASRAVDRPRRSPLVRFGAPVVLGGLAALAMLAVVLGTGLGGPVLALAAAAGVGALTLSGVGLAANLPRRAPAQRPVLDASVTGSTRELLERILAADASTRGRVAALRPQAASTPSAAEVLDDMESLLTRIDALVGSEQLQSLRLSAAELMMLEGIATRYVPELADAAGDTIGFLQTFAGTARQEALENLGSIDRQLAVLAEGVEQIESDIVGGVSRSLEVHSEFLRTRFADQHVDPLIDL